MTKDVGPLKHTSQSFVFHLLRNSYLNPCLIFFTLHSVLLMFRYLSSFIFFILTPCQIYIWKIPLSHAVDCLHSNDGVFAIQKCFIFMRSHLFIVDFKAYAISVLFIKFSSSLPCLKVQAHALLLLYPIQGIRPYVKVFDLLGVDFCVGREMRIQFHSFLCTHPV